MNYSIRTPHAPVIPRRSRRRLHPALVVLAAVVGLFVLVNLVLLAAYSGKTYPQTYVAGKQLGSVAYGDVPGRLNKLELLPKEQTLHYLAKQRPVAVAALGISVDVAATQLSLQQRHWLPLWNVVHRSDTPLTLKFDDAKLGKQLAEVQTAFAEIPVNARIEQQPTGFVLVKAKLGSVLDTGRSRAAVAAAARRGELNVTLVVARTQPPVSDARLAPPLAKLQAAQETTLTYSYAGKSYTPSVADKTSWYRGPKAAAETGTYSLSEGALRAYLAVVAKQAGVRATNTAQAAVATKAALDAAKPLNFALQATPIAAVKTYHYCTAVRGVDASLLPELDQRILQTFADERGWSTGGAVDFVRVASGCDFTIWLSAAAQMPSFGAICDSEWSCTVSPNVIINYDRWRTATDGWNTAAPGSIDDYRAMAINHETGHWFGFDHVACGAAAGQPAPVMMQQSIFLGGCSFNPWPLASEQAALRAKL